MKSYSIALIAALFLTGCGSVSYSPYSGTQESWPTADHAFVRDAHGIAVYRGLPPRPYTVLGYFTIYTESEYLDYKLAHFARQHGADAIILEQRSEGPGSSSTFGGGSGHNGFYSGSSFSGAYASTSLEARFIRFVDPPHATNAVHTAQPAAYFH